MCCLCRQFRKSSLPMRTHILEFTRKTFSPIVSNSSNCVYRLLFHCFIFPSPIAPHPRGDTLKRQLEVTGRDSTCQHPDLALWQPLLCASLSLGYLVLAASLSARLSQSLLYGWWAGSEDQLRLRGPVQPPGGQCLRHGGSHGQQRAPTGLIMNYQNIYGKKKGTILCGERC